MFKENLGLSTKLYENADNIAIQFVSNTNETNTHRYYYIVKSRYDENDEVVSTKDFNFSTGSSIIINLQAIKGEEREDIKKIIEKAFLNYTNIR